MVLMETSPPDDASTKVIVFDWDDTILPSSFLDRCQVESIAELPEHLQKIFSEIARCAEKCLYEASKHGEVIIITNSDEGWVKFSCERFCPKLMPVIDRYRIVSARTRYERFYPSQPLCWKAAAFAHEVNELYENGSEAPSLDSTDVSSDSGSEASTPPSTRGPSLTTTAASSSFPAPSASSSASREVISFGDSMEERTAVRIVSEQLSATPKSVMFINTPTPTQIIGQLNMLTNHMMFVCCHETSLDLEISPEQAERCAASYLRKHSKHLKHGDSFHLAEDLSKMLIEQTAAKEGSAGGGNSCEEVAGGV